MPPITFVTGNNQKMAIAQALCQKHHIPVRQAVFDIDEIQGEDPTRIIKDKAAKAFAACGTPVVVSDDSWDIPALGGFPGAYMKSINHWFTPADFLRLMNGVPDRSVILHQHLCYYDELESLVFTNDIPGVVLSEQRGEHPGIPWASVVTITGDNGLSLAEVFAAGLHHRIERYVSRHDAWHQMIAWYTKKHS